VKRIRMPRRSKEKEVRNKARMAKADLIGKSLRNNIIEPNTLLTLSNTYLEEVRFSKN
jgi:hypothetical protein